MSRGSDLPRSMLKHLHILVVAIMWIVASTQARAALQIGDTSRAAIDQASDVFFHTLWRDALAVTTLYGLPPVEQRRTALNAAKQLHELAQRAERELDQEIRSIEAAPEFASDAGLQQRRQQLVHVERDRRLAFLRSVGAFLHAEWNETDTAQQRSLLLLADRTFGSLIDDLEGAVLIEARIYAGLVKARLGDGAGADAMFASAARDTQATPVQVFAARMGGVIAREVAQGPEATLLALDSVGERYATLSAENVLYRLIIADRRFALRIRIGDSFSDAIATYTDLLSAATTSATAEAWQAAVFSRLASAAASSKEPLESLPVVVRIAAADFRSRDPAQRIQSIDSLERMVGIESAGLDRQTRPLALAALARALYEHGQPLFAAQRFIELASDYPDDRQARRAIELGVTILADLLRTRPGGSMDQEAKRLLQEGLGVLLNQFADLASANRWRLEAARLALEDRRFDACLKYLEQVPKESAEWCDAGVMRAATLRVRAGATQDAFQQRRLFEQLLTLANALQPEIEAREQQNPRTTTQLAVLRIYRAHAQVQLDLAHEALQTLSEFEQENQATLPADLRAEALSVYISAHHAMRQPEQAIAGIERFIMEAPEQAGDILLSVLSSMRRDVQVLLDYGRDDQAQELARRTLLPVSTLLNQWLNERLRTSSAPPEALVFQCRYRIADAQRLSGDYVSALHRYDQLLSLSPDTAELLMGKAECLYGRGDESSLTDAMSLYKRLSASAVPGGLHHEIHWLAQLRMLQILDRVNRHTDQILPRIERLRQVDDEFGGERFGKGFESLRLKHMLR